MNAIELTNVSKIYRRYSGRQFSTLKSALLQRNAHGGRRTVVYQPGILKSAWRRHLRCKRRQLVLVGDDVDLCAERCTERRLNLQATQSCGEYWRADTECRGNDKKRAEQGRFHPNPDLMLL